jgi:hypothetical protein
MSSSSISSIKRVFDDGAGAGAGAGAAMRTAHAPLITMRYYVLLAFSIILSVTGNPCPPPHPWPAYPMCSTQYPGYIDIKSVPADLIVPNITASFCSPTPGNRVLVALPGWPTGTSESNTTVQSSQCTCSVASNDTAAFFMLYLPTDYDPTRVEPYPVIVELPGNGPYTSSWGDRSNGRPDDTFLGYGITEGRGAIWAAVPFLTSNGFYDQTSWWGCPLPADAHHCGGNDTEGCISTAPPPTWAPPATGCLNTTDTTSSRAYLRAVVAYLLSAYHGDALRVVLAGFSRGAIGVNYVGLGDDETAALWAGSIAYAHYDGQPEDLRWPYPDNTPTAAYARLKRLGGRPHFVCSELDSTLNQTKPFIEAAGFFVNATYVPTGYCNHNSEWVLRNSPARDQLRKWYMDVIA